VVARLARALLLLCALAAPAFAGDVDAADHGAFWLWAGVRPQPVLDAAERVYLLHAEVVGRGTPRFEARRPAVPRIATAEVWMVVRTETLAWTPEIHDAVLRALADWRRAGNRVAGLQIDFDARTKGLSGYAAFLRDLRGRLPADTKLGVTGLLDWSANADPAGLDDLAGAVDEAVLQIYQGLRVIPGYASYLRRLDRLRMPFRIGLLQGGEWTPPPGLADHPMFRGYVVFLRNPPSTSAL
jgi:hypothetical protein